jgi:hypothetical protein
MKPEPKRRLVVLNGHKVLQVREDDEWINAKVEKAGSLRPGLYDLDAAVPADQGVAVSGVVLFVDEDTVFHQGTALTAHPRAAFEQVPASGAGGTIAYQEGRATFTQQMAPPVTKRHRR